jgi:hypothetical protein
VQGDIIENLGPIESKGDPVEALINKIVEVSFHPRERVSASIKKWCADGLLKYDLKDSRVLWRWS